MSERVGAVGQELLDRARARMVALRVEQFRLLEDIAALEAHGVAERTGDRGTSRLVQDLWHVDAHDAKRWCDEAADLVPRVSVLGESLPPRLPASATVAAAGQVGAAHVAVIRRTMARLERVDTVSVEQWAQAEATLAEQATWLPPRQLAKAAEALLARLDPDGVAPEDGEDCRDELVLVRQRRDGSLVFTGRLHDPIDGEAFCEVIDALAEPCGPDDRRELGRRRADGLKDLVQDARRPGGLATDTDQSGPTEDETVSDAGADDRAGDAAAEDAEDAAGHEPDEDALIPEPRRPEPARQTPADRPGRALLTITMDHRWLQAAAGHATLDSGERVAAATARRWACDAGIVPVVLGSRSEPLDVGRATRTVPDALRRALNLRDGGCAHPGCTRRPRRCHAHHIPMPLSFEAPFLRVSDWRVADRLATLQP